MKGINCAVIAVSAYTSALVCVFRVHHFQMEWLIPSGHVSKGSVPLLSSSECWRLQLCSAESRWNGEKQHHYSIHELLFEELCLLWHSPSSMSSDLQLGRTWNSSWGTDAHNHFLMLLLALLWAPAGWPNFTPDFKQRAQTSCRGLRVKMAKENWNCPLGPRQRDTAPMEKNKARPPLVMRSTILTCKMSMFVFLLLRRVHACWRCSRVGRGQSRQEIKRDTDRGLISASKTFYSIKNVKVGEQQ